MKRVKTIFSIELFASVLSAVVFFALYRYLYSNGFKEALGNRMKFALYITSGCVIARIIAISIKTFRVSLYANMIGIKLDKSSILIPIFGDPFFKSYIMFSTIIAVVLIGITIYFNKKFVKPVRIFS